MLTREKLVMLFEELEDQDVLSVYVDAEEHDPALRDAWRVRLDGEISKLRRQLEQETPQAVGEFDAAWTLVDRHLSGDAGAILPRRGWVAFATPEGVRHAGVVPASMPDLVRWQRGIHAAPYIRALKQERPVTVVLLDSRRARVFEHSGGVLTESEGMVADTFLGDLTDVGMHKGSGRSSGVRGETSTDQAHRLLEIAGDRMRKAVTEVVQDHAGRDGIVVLGGADDSVTKLVALLPRALQGRVTQRRGLAVDLTAAEVQREIRSAAGDLSEERHAALVGEVVDATRAGGRGTLGKEDTLRALREHRVDALLLSRGFLHHHPGVADLAVGLAFAQSADTLEVSGSAGSLLDQEAQGIAARLRYVGTDAGRD